MSDLHNAEAYPPSVRIVMESFPPAATKIANDWMRCWPQQTRRLIDSGDFLTMLALEMVWGDEVEGAVPPANGVGATNVISLAGRRPPPAPLSR